MIEDIEELDALDYDDTERIMLDIWEEMSLQESFNLIYEATGSLDMIWEGMKAILAPKIIEIYKKESHEKNHSKEND